MAINLSSMFEKIFRALVHLVLIASCEASAAEKIPNPLTDQISKFVQEINASYEGELDKSIKFKFAETPSRDLILVYVTGRTWCGTGGCTLFILGNSSGHLKIIGRIPAAHLPIRVLNQDHQALPDIVITATGGGIRHPYEAILSFNGISYISNYSEQHERSTRRIRTSVGIYNSSKEYAAYP